MAASTLLISGTDTGVGKTTLTACLATYCQIYHPDRRLGIYKPIQSGIGDREYFRAALNLPYALEQITPLYYQTPVASAIAARREQQPVDLGLLWQHLQTWQAHTDLLLVEGMGGLGSPITWEYLNADLARDWHLPVVLAVPLRLGAMGQAIAHLALARLAQVQVIGLVVCCTEPHSRQYLEDWFPPALISRLLTVPILGILPYVPDLRDRSALARAAAQLELGYLGIF
ncbi:MAG: dethiobiotin synthase [Pseudanabaenaceae cyanobacterium bins.68]|nr:dethiobiotin synthase [Pseudanabaenaceae cyanobacterium bins.68]